LPEAASGCASCTKAGAEWALRAITPPKSSLDLAGVDGKVRKQCIDVEIRVGIPGRDSRLEVRFGRDRSAGAADCYSPMNRASPRNRTMNRSRIRRRSGQTGHRQQHKSGEVKAAWLLQGVAFLSPSRSRLATKKPSP
jgi:hypothetical protein